MDNKSEKQHMDKRQLKLGWSLVLLWFVAIAVVIFNYQATDKRVQNIELMGDYIHEFRNSLYFDKPYRSQMTSQQVQLLSNITELCEELKPKLAMAWFQPDVQQLLFTTKRFVELSHAYIDTELALKDLITDIQQKRELTQSQAEVEALYYQLSANVFEALFSSQTSSSLAYRDLDALYSQSQSLSPQQRVYLQAALADTSTVMSRFAQGGYLVERLITHSVHSEVRQVEIQFHHALERAMVIGIVLSGVLITAIMAMFHSMVVNRVEGSDESSVDHLNQEIEYESDEPIEEVVSQPTSSEAEQEKQQAQIDFSVMLDTLDGDTESVCMLLEVFIEDHKDDVEQISQQLSQAPDEAMRKAHSLKGVGGNLGAYQLRDIAAQIEEAIGQNITLVEPLLPVLESRLKQAMQEAQAFIEQHNS
ncbi:Hpt domain-containing protein [Vibrio rhodolitus]|uniref:Hpt domain-containing protein n=1 Tax=Vibrio rhodolitus TaxID=2231649 RepID=UPI0013E0568C|nr:Hpt domain-containing protein [Vibrio rhodolitus]